MNFIKKNDSFAVWKLRNYIDDVTRPHLNLRELLKYFRQLDKLKANEEVDSVFSEADCSDVFHDTGGYDSGVYSATTEISNKNRPLSLREVCVQLLCSR